MDAIPAFILWILLPAWIMCGFLDWICHRKSGIAEHCGPWESILHLLLLAEAGAALLIGLLLELNEPTLALIALCFIAHEITGYADIRFAHARRNLSAVEQRIHDYMTAIPVTALVLVGILHKDAVAALASDPLRIFTVPLQDRCQPPRFSASSAPWLSWTSFHMRKSSIAACAPAASAPDIGRPQGTPSILRGSPLVAV